MAEEKLLRINLREELVKKPRWKRNRLVILRLKNKLKRILHSDNVLLDTKISEKVYKSSKPPMKFTLKIVKEEDKYKVELVE